MPQTKIQEISHKLGIELEEPFSLRIIKPFKYFYNQLITLCLKYRIFDLHMVSCEDFVDAAKHMLGDVWKDSLLEPTKYFYNLCVAEEKKCTSHSEPTFFENVKCQLLQDWNSVIIEKAQQFKRTKIGP